MLVSAHNYSYYLSMSAVAYTKNLIHKASTHLYNNVNVALGIKVMAVGVGTYAASNYLGKLIFDTEDARENLGWVRKPIHRLTNMTLAGMAMCLTAGATKWEAVKFPYNAVRNLPLFFWGPIHLIGGFAVGKWLGDFAVSKIPENPNEENRLSRFLHDNQKYIKAAFPYASGIGTAAAIGAAFGTLKPTLSALGSVTALGMLPVINSLPSTSDIFNSIPKIAGSVGRSIDSVLAESIRLTTKAIASSELRFIGFNILVMGGTFLAISQIVKRSEILGDNRKVKGNAAGTVAASIVTFGANWYWMKAAYNMVLFKLLKLQEVILHLVLGRCCHMLVN